MRVLSLKAWTFVAIIYFELACYTRTHSAFLILGLIYDATFFSREIFQKVIKGELIERKIPVNIVSGWNWKRTDIWNQNCRYEIKWCSMILAVINTILAIV